MSKTLLEMTEEERRAALCKARERFAKLSDKRVARGFHSLLSELPSFFYEIFEKDFNGKDFTDRWILANFYWQELVIAKEEREKRKALSRRLHGEENSDKAEKHEDFDALTRKRQELAGAYRTACFELTEKIDSMPYCRPDDGRAWYRDAEKLWERVKETRAEFEREVYGIECRQKNAADTGIGNCIDGGDSK